MNDETPEERAKVRRRLFEPAPAGKIWQCMACGKKSATKSGIHEDGRRAVPRSPGWDESCMLNAELVDVEPS